MSKWILILALNFSDGGTALQHAQFETKEACDAALAISVHAVQQVIVNPFLWSGTCMSTVKPPVGIKPPAGESKPKETPKDPPAKQSVPFPIDKSTLRDVVY